jgi:predicted short-subunit dehydrogenase-like oxidoreductase (DUF2520 family)
LNMLSVTIIGVGKMGGALALALDRVGFTIDNLVRKPSNSPIPHLPFNSSKPNYINEITAFDSDAIFITTQDSEIECVAKQIFPSNRKNQIVFHTSGSLSSDVLHNLIEKGYEIGSIHPLVSISDQIIGAEHFSGSFFCIEGSEGALEIANKIVNALGGKPFSIESNRKTLYHASAVTACGHIVALFSVAVEMLSKCGLNETDAKEILLPLLKSTVENISIQPTENALTGTFARLDEQILENQVSAIRETMPNDILDIFLALGLQSLKLNRNNAPERLEKIERMAEVISIAKNQSRC